MRTFADLLRYYNNLDVSPGLEALQKMRASYTEKGIDILKDAASLPGVSMHYLLRGTIERGAKLFSLRKEAYEMLKGVVVGEQSLVFKRYHAAGETTIRPHRFKNPKPCRRVIGYDANLLYLSTMLHDMSCGKEIVVHYDLPEKAVEVFAPRLKAGAWFWLAEVDIEILKRLWMKFEEMPPLFLMKHIPDEAMPQHMKDYCRRTSRAKSDRKKLVSTLAAK